MAFRPLPEREVWEAGVGMVTRQRWIATDDQSWLEGSPDLVVEVLSPSNTLMELNEGVAHTYGIGAEIPLDRFVPAQLAVTDVFADSPLTVSK